MYHRPSILCVLLVLFTLNFSSCKEIDEESYLNDTSEVLRFLQDDTDKLDLLKKVQFLPLQARSLEFYHILSNQFGERKKPVKTDEIRKESSDPRDKKCHTDLMYIISKLRSRPMNDWLLALIDSYGKLGSSILRGNIRWEGGYPQCLSVYAPPDDKSFVSHHAGFNGRYCEAFWKPKNRNITVPILTGICVPDSCNGKELKQEAAKLAKILHYLPIFRGYINQLELDTIYCPEPRQLGTSGILCISMIILLIVLALIATLFDSLRTIPSKSESSNEDDDEQVETSDEDNIVVLEESELILFRNSPRVSKFFRLNLFIRHFTTCFSLIENGKKLMNTESKDNVEIKCLHGIRVLSMAWIILGHTYLFSMLVLKDVFNAFDGLDNLPSYTILNASLAVDTFFTISGFLVAYLFMCRIISGNQRFNLLLFYLRRYVRMTPVYGMVIWIVAQLGPHITSGPFWDYDDTEYSLIKLCRVNWWYNILYINNFLTTSKQCLSYAWYLANDFQFYLISPVFMFLLSRWPKVGISFSSMIIFLSSLITFYTVYTNHYHFYWGSSLTVKMSTDINVTAETNNGLDYLDNVYEKPWTRIGPYVIGLLAGYLYQTHGSKGFRLSERPSLIFNTLSVLIGLTCLYSTYHSRALKESNLVLSVHQSTFRLGWSISIAWLIYGCSLRYSVLVNNFLSAPLWIPLSRLTFSAFIIHPTVLMTFFGSFKSTIAFSHFTTIAFAISNWIFSYLMALILSLLIEVPVMKIEKILLEKV